MSVPPLDSCLKKVNLSESQFSEIKEDFNNFYFTSCET